MPDIAPLSINLDLTTACNYACDHCIDWDILNSKREARGRAAAPVDSRAWRSAGLRSVILIGGGEPTLYPGFVEFVVFLKELGLAVVGGHQRQPRRSHPEGGAALHRTAIGCGCRSTRAATTRSSSHAPPVEEVADARRDLLAGSPRSRLRIPQLNRWDSRSSSRGLGGSRGDVKVVENIHEMVMASQARVGCAVRLHLVQAVPRAPGGRRRGHGSGQDRSRAAAP